MRSFAIALCLFASACRGGAPQGDAPPTDAATPTPSDVTKAERPKTAPPPHTPPALTQAQLSARDEAAGRCVIKDDEEVVLFPAAAWLDEGAATWRIPLHGWIYEPEEDDLTRRGIVQGLREVLGDDPRVDTRIFGDRIRPFIVDNERDKVVDVTIAGEIVTLPPSSAGGHFEGEAALAQAIASRWAPDGRLDARAITSDGDARSFVSRVHLVGPTGLFIVSDVDDTVKITNVLDKKECLANTFLEPFRAVDGMAEMYRRWLDRAPGGHLHFVSSSPWQLFPPLTRMMEEAGFPPATFTLKTIRPKSTSLLDLFADPMTTKPPAIAALIERWPQRAFVLVGDSGEKDPEVYGEIARRYPDAVKYIAIRDVTGEDAKAPRYATAFAGVKAPWEIFTEPSSLRGPPADLGVIAPD